MRNLLQNLFGRKLKNLLSRKATRPRPRRFRPNLECLDERIMLSVSNLFVRHDAETGSHAEVSHARQARAATPRIKTVAALRAVEPLSSTEVLLRFSKRLGNSADDPNSYIVPGLTVLDSQVSADRKSVTLTTTPAAAGTAYTVQFNQLLTQTGARVTGAARIATWSAPASDTTSPRVVGAVSTSNHTVVVSFSEAMDDNALDHLHYSVVHDSVNVGAGMLRIVAARFVDGSRTAVELDTDSQSEVTYRATAVNVRDLAGNQLAFAVLAGGVRVDPTTATFQGRPPSGPEVTDTDGDGLTDHQEQFGWTASFRLINGQIVTRNVTSDPLNPDTDGDMFTDAAEAALRLDPRDPDTDDDLLGDNQEFNEIFSDPANQDTDADSLDDGLEFLFFKTSVVHRDTDGDQLPDGEEVLLANRNARVADLPDPAIEVGEINLQLDVRFTETTSTETRELESRTVDSTLFQSNRQEFSNMNSTTTEAAFKLSTELSFEVNISKDPGVKIGGKFGTESTSSRSWTTQHTEASAAETQRTYEDSLQTQVETTESTQVERQVFGALMQVSVSLKNISNLAYRVRNLQVTAFFQDPQEPTRLVPLATLRADAAPDGGFTLGPLTPERGPIILSSETVFPSLVESLMRNPRGLVFRLANYDIVDELGRNFAFTSREIVDRTGALVIDFGGFDGDGDGEGDQTEQYRVATGSGRVIDTNGDGVVDGNDHRVVFDAIGGQVGITLREALAAIGLSHFDEDTTPTDSLTDDQLLNSYSTYRDNAGVERFFRVRTVAREFGIRKSWEVITPTGIDQTIGPDDVILRTDSNVYLAFVQDLDGDRLPANLEFIFNTSDQFRDTDDDTLDDRFESLIGWTVDLAARGARHVTSSGSLADPDGDGLTDAEEAPGNLIDRNGDGLIDRAERSGPDEFVSDPLNADTDGDGISDLNEVRGYSITLRRTGEQITAMTDPANFDSDGDTASDGTERRLGGNPNDISDRDDFADDDRDGLANIEEDDGWDIVIFATSTTAGQQGGFTSIHVSSDRNRADTDGDGLLDGAEFSIGTDPRADLRDATGTVTEIRGSDTDKDGLTDPQEVRGIVVRDLGIIVLSPIDADTDNDRRSDGAEAELTDVEANRWIIRVAGEVPYRVFSNPLVADADFDRMADGDEFAQRTDPTKVDTDGDSRDDRRESQLQTDPLAQDVRVTVVYTSLVIDSDSEENDNEGDIGFDFSVRLPDPNTLTGLSLSPTHLVVEQIVTNGDIDYQYIFRSDVESRLVDDPFDPFDSFGIEIQSNRTLFLVGLVPLAERSITFNLRLGEHFTVEGVVHEQDGRFPDLGSWVYFGGLNGRVQATVGGDSQTVQLFEADSLFQQTFETFAFRFFKGPDNIGFDTNGTGLQGAVTGYYVISR